MPEYYQNNSVAWRLLAALVMGNNYWWSRSCANVWVKVGVPVTTRLITHLQVRNLLYECHVHNQKVKRELGQFLWVVGVGRMDSNLFFFFFNCLPVQRKKCLGKTQLVDFSQDPSKPTEKNLATVWYNKTPNKPLVVFMSPKFSPKIFNLVFLPSPPGCHFTLE